MINSSPMVAMKSIFNFRRFSGTYCLEFISKIPKENCFPVTHYSRLPVTIPAIPVNTINPTPISFMLTYVFMVFLVCYFPKIFYSVIRSSMIYMIKLIYWKNTVNVQPRKTMRAIQFPVNFYSRISFCFASGGVAYAYLASCLPYFPSKYSSFRIIMKNFFESFLGYNSLSHWLSPKKSLMSGAVLSVPRCYSNTEVVTHA